MYEISAPIQSRLRVLPRILLRTLGFTATAQRGIFDQATR